MASLLVKVKSKVSLHAHEKVRGLLEGQYGSVFKGRSMDFDDLREYIPGDDVKDIDWKASARSGQMRIKRYVAIRKHNILLVVDTGRAMAATSAGGQPKKDIAIMIAGIIGYIAQKHGDLVAMVAGDTDRSQYFPLKGSSEHLERLLQHINTHPTLQSPQSNLARQLEYIARSIRRRMMLIIIADDLSLTTEHEQLLRRLRAQHELLWVTVGDWSVTNSAAASSDALQVYDVADDVAIPAYFRSSKTLQQQDAAQTVARRVSQTQFLERLGITSQRVTDESDVISGLFALLERQKYAKRR